MATASTDRMDDARSLCVVYSPASPLRQPGQFLRRMLGDLRASRTLAWRQIVRDISAQYRQTILGYLWAILPAILTTLVWVLVNRSQMLVVKTGAVPYAIYALTGTVFWLLFVDALNGPLKQLGGNKSMLNRVNFPTEALLLSGMAQVLFSFLFKLIVLAVALVVLSAPVHWTALLIVFPVVAFVALGTMLGILLVPVGLLYKDIEQALIVIVTPLMFLTPVVYPPPAGTLGTIMNLNPLTPLFELTRGLLYGGVGGSVGPVALVSGITILAMAVSWLLYRLSLPILIERLEA